MAHLALIVCIMAIVLRGLSAINKYKSTFKTNFTWSGYFDILHTIRWISHVVSSAICFLLIPEGLLLLEKSYEGASNFQVIASGIVGYAGYDLIRWIEKLCLKIVGMINSNIEAKIKNRPYTSDVKDDNDKITTV